MYFYQWPLYVAREVIPLRHSLLEPSISIVDVLVSATETHHRRDEPDEREHARERYFRYRRADISSSSILLEILFH